MAKFDSVESVKAKYEAGERVFTSHEVMVLLTHISHLENADQQSVQPTLLESPRTQERCDCVSCQQELSELPQSG